MQSNTEAVVRRCSSKYVFLKNSANFTGKPLCWSLFVLKLQAFSHLSWLRLPIQKECPEHNAQKKCTSPKLKKLTRSMNRMFRLICLNLTINTPDQYQSTYSGVFIVTFNISNKLMQ